MRNPSSAHLPTRLQYDVLMLLAEIAARLGKGSVPVELGNFLIDLLLPGSLAGKIRSLAVHGWMSLDGRQENFQVHAGILPKSGHGLFGPSFRNVPAEAAANLAAHWNKDIRRFRAEHLLDPPEESPPKRGRKPATTPTVVRNVPVSTPSPAPSIPEPPPELPAAPQETTMPDKKITADPHSWPKRPIDGDETYAVGPRKKVAVIDATDWAIMGACHGRDDLGALKLDIARFRRLTQGQVDGMAATMTRQARAKENAAPTVEPAAVTPTNPTPASPTIAPTPVPEPAPTQVTQPPLDPNLITADPATWPPRPLEPGGHADHGPRRMIHTIDETDLKIASVIRGRGDAQVLNLRLMAIRRLSAAQMGALNSVANKREARQRAGDPIEPVATIAPAPVPTLRLRTKGEIAQEIVLYDHEIAELSRRRDNLRHLHDNYDPIVATLTVERP